MQSSDMTSVTITGCLFVNTCMFILMIPFLRGRSHCSWIYNYLCNQCLSRLKLWLRMPLMVRCTQYNIMW